MKKKSLSFIIIIITVLLLNCSISRVELGLIGTWKGSYTSAGTSNDVELTFFNNDSGKMEFSSHASSASTTIDFTLTKADSALKTITLKFKSAISGSEENTYDYILSRDNLTIKGIVGSDLKLKKL